MYRGKNASKKVYIVRKITVAIIETGRSTIQCIFVRNQNVKQKQVMRCVYVKDKKLYNLLHSENLFYKLSNLCHSLYHCDDRRSAIIRVKKKKNKRQIHRAFWKVQFFVNHLFLLKRFVLRFGSVFH